MALALTPRLLRRGLALFVIISLAGVVALLFYGDNLRAFLDALASIHWQWLLIGLALASMDWIGGGHAPLGGAPAHPAGCPARRHDRRRGLERGGGVPQPFPVRCRAPDDVPHEARRSPSPGRLHRHL